jgi:hypothetical protein
MTETPSEADEFLNTIDKTIKIIEKDEKEGIDELHLLSRDEILNLQLVKNKFVLL